MTSQFNQELAQLSQLYVNITDSTQRYADLLIHLLHEYTHSDQAPQFFQTLVQHLTAQSTSSESILDSLYQDCAFELFPALVTAFDVDPVTFTAIFTAMVKHGRPRELLLLIQEQWSAHPSQYALNNLLLTCACTLLERLGEKSASHLDALARASVKLLCQVPARDDGDHEQHDDDEQVLAVQTLNSAEQLRNNRTTRHEDDSLKHISQYLDRVLDVLEHVTASRQQLSSTMSKAIFRLLELLLSYLETLSSRAVLLIVRTVPRVQEFMQLLQHGLDTSPHVIGGYLYLLYLRGANLPLEIVHRPPLVYAPRHVFAASVPYWTALLSTDSPRVRQCGVRLITWCTSEHVMVGDLELGDFKCDTSEDISQHPALLLAQAIVDYVVRCENQQKRIAVFNSLNDYLTLFCERDHYALLIALIAHCPYPHVSAAFIDQYRKLLPHVTTDSPFMKHLVDNLTSWLTARDLVTGRDMLNAALSLTRLSLLNRHVSKSAALHAHHVELLNCVKRLDEQLVVEIRREISNSDWEAQKETASLMTRQGLSSMSARDIDVAQQQHIVQLQMIHSLVTRVIELLNEARDTQS